jgi:caffeoyl-CoA O-methyltransferase
MQIAPEQGQLLALLVRLIGAKRTIEVGVFTGYSSLAVALALPDDGRILACDISDEYTRIARMHWQKAGVAHKLELVLAPAQQTLDAKLAAGAAGSFDFAFIDADKPGYPAYWEEILRRLRPGGLIAIDNVLWEGEVVRPEQQGEDVVAIRAFNELVVADPRVESVMLALADGLTIARKLP